MFLSMNRKIPKYRYDDVMGRFILVPARTGRGCRWDPECDTCFKKFYRELKYKHDGSKWVLDERTVPQMFKHLVERV